MFRKIRYLFYRLRFKYPWLNGHRPIHVDIELNRSCNLKCPFCYRQDELWKHEFPNDIMISNMAKRYLKEAYLCGIRAVKFNWRGDPLCYSRLSEVCKYAYELGYLDIMVNTNLASDNISNLLDSAQYLTEIRVSIDTLQPELYAEMRKGAEIQQTLSNLAELTRQYRGRLIIQRRTNEKCENDYNFYFRLCEKNFQIKLREVSLRNYGEVKIDSKPIQPRICVGNIQPYATKAEEEYYHSAPKISMSYNEAWREGELKRQYCKQPSQRIVISVDGRVFACCLAYNEPESLYLGDMNRIPLSKIIDSHMRGRVINKLQHNKFEDLPVCEKCTSYSAYKESLNAK